MSSQHTYTFAKKKDKLLVEKSLPSTSLLPTLKRRAAVRPVGFEKKSVLSFVYVSCRLLYLLLDESNLYSGLL